MANVLNSWKEIAAYLGRGVRTAQRWERDLALPVRRPRGTDRSAVFAVPAEIDEWQKKCPAHSVADSDTRPQQLPPSAIVKRAAPQEWQVVHRNADRLFSGAEILQQRTMRLQQQMERAILLGKKLNDMRSADRKTFHLPPVS